MTRLVGVRAVCDGCSAAAAVAFCVVHRNVLCSPCDADVHHAASSHQRVDLAGALTALPFCDTCDGAPATMYCESESATMCDRCDRELHAVNEQGAPPHCRTLISRTLQSRAVEFTAAATAAAAAKEAALRGAPAVEAAGAVAVTPAQSHHPKRKGPRSAKRRGRRDLGSQSSSDDTGRRRSHVRHSHAHAHGRRSAAAMGVGGIGAEANAPAATFLGPARCATDGGSSADGADGPTEPGERKHYHSHHHRASQSGNRTAIRNLYPSSSGDVCSNQLLTAVASLGATFGNDRDEESEHGADKVPLQSDDTNGERLISDSHLGRSQQQLLTRVRQQMDGTVKDEEDVTDMFDVSIHSLMDYNIPDESADGMRDGGGGSSGNRTRYGSADGLQGTSADAPTALGDLSGSGTGTGTRSGTASGCGSSRRSRECNQTFATLAQETPSTCCATVTDPCPTVIAAAAAAAAAGEMYLLNSNPPEPPGSGSSGGRLTPPVGGNHQPMSNAAGVAAAAIAAAECTAAAVAGGSLVHLSRLSTESPSPSPSGLALEAFAESLTVCHEGEACGTEGMVRSTDKSTRLRTHTAAPSVPQLYESGTNLNESDNGGRPVQHRRSGGRRSSQVGGNGSRPVGSEISKTEIDVEALTALAADSGGGSDTGGAVQRDERNTDLKAAVAAAVMGDEEPNGVGCLADLDIPKDDFGAFGTIDLSAFDHSNNSGLIHAVGRSYRIRSSNSEDGDGYQGEAFNRS